jgi:hypothetical protein
MDLSVAFTLDIVPAESKKPFEGPDNTHYCNICNTYNNDFAPSSVKGRDRRCRPCLALKRKEKTNLVQHPNRIKIKLKQHLIYLQLKDYARTVTEETVIQILNAYGIEEGDWGKVKAIKASIDPVKGTLATMPIFF